MPRPALTEEQRRETRRNIRRAASKLYAERGLGEVSARAVAEAAGVSVGTLYSYFDNLTVLMQSLWKEPVAGLLNDFEEAIKDVPDPFERIQILMQTYAEFASRQRAVYRGAFLYVRPEYHDSPEAVSLEDDRFFNLFRGAVADAQAQGQVRAGDPTELAQTLWAGMHGAIALPLNLDRLALDPPETSLPRMIDALLEWLQA